MCVQMDYVCVEGLEYVLKQNMVDRNLFQVTPVHHMSRNGTEIEIGEREYYI